MKTELEQLQSALEQLQSETIRKMSCPKCGGLLVYREGKFGGFTGCNRYPKCDYTKPKQVISYEEDAGFDEDWELAEFCMYDIH